MTWVLTADNWNGIIRAIETGGRYVSLDLSACTPGTHTEGPGLRSDGTFAPNGKPTETQLANAEASLGKTFIVELVLPDGATKILAGSSKGGAFLNFLSLTKISGKHITEIGNAAFYMDPGGATPNLTEANFPKVTTLGNQAFAYCYELTSVSFPEVTTIGNSAFASCDKLTSVSLPKVTTIGTSAFASCFKLPSIALPKVTQIGTLAFNLCEKLATADFPELTTITAGTYNTSTGVPAGGAFTGCTALVTLNIPKIATLGGQAFTLCENPSPLVITMGATAPAVGENLFLNVNSPRTVTVRRPATNTGYTNEWQTNFKGKGWNGTSISTITNEHAATPDNNSYITVTVTN